MHGVDPPDVRGCEGAVAYQEQDTHTRGTTAVISCSALRTRRRAFARIGVESTRSSTEASSTSAWPLVDQRRFAVKWTLGLQLLAGYLVTVLWMASSAAAQAPGAPQGGRGGGRGAAQPQVVSPEVTADRRVTFRILAPQADSVRLAAGDIPGAGAAQLTKGENGVWATTTGPVPPGAYRYNFNVDGVATIDPRNPLTSESQNNAWSVVQVPGSEFADTRNVPHGSVAEVTYYSTALDGIPPDARLHSAGIRIEQPQVPGVLSAARRGG